MEKVQKIQLPELKMINFDVSWNNAALNTNWNYNKIIINQKQVK
jgi:hypothetical protein